MRKLLFAAALVVAAATGAFASPISSQWLSGPYCATAGSDGNATTCGFQTLQQCQAFVAGLSGSCNANSNQSTDAQARYAMPYSLPFGTPALWFDDPDPHRP